MIEKLNQNHYKIDNTPILQIGLYNNYEDSYLNERNKGQMHRFNQYFIHIEKNNIQKQIQISSSL